MKKQARPGLEGRCNRCRRQWSGQGPAEPRKALSKRDCRKKKEYAKSFSEFYRFFGIFAKKRDFCKDIKDFLLYNTKM